MIAEDDLKMLSAYADDELEGQALSAFKERLLAEPELRRELDMINENDELLKGYARQIDSRDIPKETQALVAVHSARSAVKLLATCA